jgi:hypothetical protein
MPTKLYKEARVCECGYTTFHPGNWCTHKKSCKSVITDDKERIASLEKDKEQLREQLAAKDEQLVKLCQERLGFVKVFYKPYLKRKIYHISRRYAYNYLQGGTYM